MSIGSHLLTKENLALVGRSSWTVGRPLVVDQGLRYYDAHPDDVDRIRRNLEHIGLPSTGADLDETLRHIAAHYFEKLFGLVKRYETVWIARNRVELGDAIEPFREARAAGRAVFIAECHFGGTYVLPAVLMTNQVEATMVGRFPEPVGSLFNATSAALVERYGVTPIHLLNVDDPDADVPFRMMSLLMRGQVVSNVFDEPNQLARPVTLLGRTIRGGSGMDRILRRFTDEKVSVVTPFLVRTSDETFRLEVDRHSLAGGDLIESLYRSLERRLRATPHQWYFIHELHEAFVEHQT
jgi:lauroyl/myristoyl acyltransferase